MGQQDEFRVESASVATVESPQTVAQAAGLEKPFAGNGRTWAGGLITAAILGAAGFGVWRWLSRGRAATVACSQTTTQRIRTTRPAAAPPVKHRPVRPWLPMAPPVDEIALRARLADLEPFEVREKVIAAWACMEPWQWQEVAVQVLHGLRGAGFGTRRLCADLGLTSGTVTEMTADDHATLLAWVHERHPSVLLDALAPHHHAVEALGLIRV